MPAFRDQEILSEREIGLIVDWLRRDWYEPAPAPTAAQVSQIAAKDHKERTDNNMD
jgi:mono/diheme cytochrome c family protein